jgi:hypothetical protein
MELFFHFIKYVVWWQVIDILEDRNTILPHVIYFAYSAIHLVCSISKSIQPNAFGDNFITNNSERLHIGNVKEAYQSTNKVNYIAQIHKHNDRCTVLADMEETLLNLILQN